MLEPSEIERVLAVMAHPDDVDFGASGTIAGLVAGGASVTYCICTDGDAGGFDPAVHRSEIPGIRRREQLAAAACVGVRDVRFLGYPDGALEPTQELRRDLTRVVRQVRPQLVIAQTPERNWDRMPASHPDHMAAGEATMRGLYPDARNPYAHPSLLADEGLDAWTVSEVWVAGHPEIDHVVDITAHFDAKLAALRAHESQTAHLDLEPMLRHWNADNATRFGLPEGHLAEIFFRRPLPT